MPAHALGSPTVRWNVVERNCIWVRGIHAGSYLHSQLSNDIAGLESLHSCQSFVLEPTGKINSLVRVTRGPRRAIVDSSESEGSAPEVETYLLDTDAEGEDFAQLVQRLERFKIRVKADLVTGKISMISLRVAVVDGEQRADHEITPWTRPELQTMVADLGPSLVVDAWWGDGRAFDVLITPFVEDNVQIGAKGSDAKGSDTKDKDNGDRLGQLAQKVIDALAIRGITCLRADPDEIEYSRVTAGWPAMGSEIRPGETIPAATGIVRQAASFTKGCYPGQELVERMDSRGSTAPQSLRIVPRRELGALGPGDVITLDGANVGTVTSVAMDAALAYVSRSVELGMVVGSS